MLSGAPASRHQNVLQATQYMGHQWLDLVGRGGRLSFAETVRGEG